MFLGAGYYAFTKFVTTHLPVSGALTITRIFLPRTSLKISPTVCVAIFISFSSFNKLSGNYFLIIVNFHNLRILAFTLLDTSIFSMMIFFRSKIELSFPMVMEKEQFPYSRQQSVICVPRIMTGIVNYNITDKIGKNFFFHVVRN